MLQLNAEAQTILYNGIHHLSLGLGEQTDKP